MTNQEARDDERDTASPEPWIEAVNRALWHYDMGLLDVHGVAETLARKHPGPEITDEMVERAANAVARETSKVIWPEGHYGIARAALEAAFRVPVSDSGSGEGEQ